MRVVLSNARVFFPAYSDEKNWISKSSKVILTLPEGEKDDRLDHEELEYGVVRDKQLTCSKVEEEERVERQADRDVINDGDIQVTTGNTGGNTQKKSEYWD